MKPARTTRRRPLVVSAFGLIAAFTAGTSRGALIVNTDLGLLAPGSVSLSGTTVGGSNNANHYTNSNQTLFWGSEYVYQFSLDTSSSVSVTSDDPNATIDNDFFLLNSLVTTPSGAFNIGSGVGSLIEVSGSFGILPAGTYYLSIDAYAGTNSAGAGNTGPFSASLVIALPPPPPPAQAALTGGSMMATLDAGQVIWYSFPHAGGPFSVDTFGSTLGPGNDTELFLYSSLGGLVAANDDSVGLLSQITIANLASGDYYLAAGGWESVGAAGFNVTSTSGESGNLVINGIQLVPEPGTAALALIGAMTGLRRRRTR